jgi:hypothetical protein
MFPQARAHAHTTYSRRCQAFTEWVADAQPTKHTHSHPKANHKLPTLTRLARLGQGDPPHPTPLHTPLLPQTQAPRTVICPSQFPQS